MDTRLLRVFSAVAESVLCLRHWLNGQSLKVYQKGAVLRLEVTTYDLTFYKHHREVAKRDGSREWRTAPLWGIGQALRAPNVGLLHDGRARNVLEAILWHDGEAAAARKHVEQLPAADRQALIDFIGSL